MSHEEKSLPSCFTTADLRGGGGWGGTALWQVLVTSGYAHNKNTSLPYRPTTVG